ncbi:hypothetical protein IC229_05765 [Spirosoma sp. BT702]|uniref:Uncharacterized protein n=1 Tax=Spirosoma profusum TaxID=2771354 RepID=A0A926XU08_9BACT|nr:hypothetical protein [Spirosoma profusum]MBD2700132.1 hypothetical protein [Spirosoma profusum]
MKPIKTKPMLYAHYLGLLQEKAREMGYNLVLHGSLNRDCDLIAIPWVDQPQPHLDLIRALDYILTGRGDDAYKEPEYYLYSILPGGRHSYVINIYRGGYRSDDSYVEDPQFYLDISVTPLVERIVSSGVAV